MLDVLGLNVDSPFWADSGADRQLETVVDGLVAALLAQRQEARGRRDFAAADAIRDALADLGVDVSDTPAGPRWSVSSDLSASSVAIATTHADKSGGVRG
jgi:cysteinyl-tRNA synthetase